MLAAFAVLVSGRKSEKLHFAFQLFDTDQDDLLSFDEMTKYFKCFLTMIFALNTLEQDADTGAQLSNNIMIEDSAGHIVTRVVKETDSGTPEISDEITISFESFADWYTKGGFQNTLWLELVDLHKWPSLEQQHGYVFDLVSGFRLEISIHDGASLRGIVKRTQLGSVSPDMLTQVICASPRVGCFFGGKVRCRNKIKFIT